MTIAAVAERFLLLGIVRMGTRGLYRVVLLLIIGCQGVGLALDKSTLLSDAATQADISEQLKINRDALLKGSSDQIRIDAATVMMFSEDPVARQILVAALEQSENVPARVAVCKALIQTRISQRLIKSKEDFIEPLMGILLGDDSESAKLAAEATLIFDYEQISALIEKMVSNSSLSVKVRLNLVYALQIHPDMGAIFKLMELLGDPESQVAAAAEENLRSQGIPIGSSAQEREQIKEELKKKGRAQFLSDLVVRQEARIRDLGVKLNQWQGFCLAAYDRIYDSLKEDAAKGVFLVENLSSPEVVLKLWALAKIEQTRTSTAPKLPVPDQLGPVFVNLVSDPDRSVRLKTARLLSIVVELNSAERLLEQLKSEQDDQVKTELFKALAGACHYALSPNSGTEISAQVRKEALEWASRYLIEEDPQKAREGAEAIKKLLEHNGLTPEEVGKYLSLLIQRHDDPKSSSDSLLRGGLLNAMAELCGQSYYKAESAKLFRGLFEKALSDEADLVREAAVTGLIYVDKNTALGVLRKGFVNDSSASVRRKLIDLAGEVGAGEDLSWLVEKIGPQAEGQAAWQAVLKILKQCDAGVVAEWVTKFGSEDLKVKLSDEQMLALLETAERKAVGENRLEMLGDIRIKLARFCATTGRYERAAEYWGMLQKSTQSPEDKQVFLAELLEVYLRWPMLEAATQLVGNCLLEGDLGPQSKIVVCLDEYLGNPGKGDPSLLLKSLCEIQIPNARPMWQEWLSGWKERLAAVGGKSDKTQNPG